MNKSQGISSNANGYRLELPGNVRLPIFWSTSYILTFEISYNKAREIKIQQDAFCEKAINGDWAGQSNFPEELQWEAAVDVLRGKVKV